MSSDPQVPSLDHYLTEARSRITILSPAEALRSVENGAVIVDVRPEANRRTEGVVPGSVWFDLTVLEWRAAASSPARDERLMDRPIIVMCNEGYSSSLAVDRLRHLGRTDAADLEGGFRAWKAVGLPVEEANPPS